MPLDLRPKRRRKRVPFFGGMAYDTPAETDVYIYNIYTQYVDRSISIIAGMHHGYR